MLLYNKHIYVFDLIELMYDIRVATKDDIDYEKYLEELILDTLINTFGFILNTHLDYYYSNKYGSSYKYFKDKVYSNIYKGFNTIPTGGLCKLELNITPSGLTRIEITLKDYR